MVGVLTSGSFLLYNSICPSSLLTSKMKKNHVGLKYGRLLVIENLPEIQKYNQRLLCRCDCGVEKAIESKHLVSGKISSCGCLASELKKKPLTHGMSNSDEYAIWCGIKKRCKSASDYVSKGIKVCARWESSFENFIEDMGARPSEKHSIDRINNLDGYSPENCRWATDKEQAQNKSNNRFITYAGRTLAMSEMARAYGLSPQTLWSRLKSGKTVEDALTTPLR